MKVIITETSSIHFNHDTISVFDDDGREIVLRRGQIQELKHLLSKTYSTRPYPNRCPVEITK